MARRAKSACSREPSGAMALPDASLKSEASFRTRPSGDTAHTSGPKAVTKTVPAPSTATPPSRPAESSFESSSSVTTSKSTGAGAGAAASCAATSVRSRNAFMPPP